MNKENKILLCLLAIIAIISVVCGYFAFTEEKVIEKTDAMKIKEEYSNYNGKVSESTKQEYPSVELSDENPFVYKSGEEIIKILEGKSGVIYFGFSTCPWCRTMLPILEEAAKEVGIKEIAYLDIKNMRDILELDENDKIVTTKEGNVNYYKILELMDNVLEDYTLISKEKKEIKTGKKRLFAPTVVVIKNGVIEDIHIGTLDSQTNGYEELSKDEKTTLKNTYTEMLKKLTNNNCKEGC